jgi:hypothetical protein
MSAGKNKIPQGSQVGFEGIYPGLKAFDFIIAHGEGPWAGTFRIGEHAANSKQMVLNVAKGGRLGLEYLVVHQPSNHSIELVERAIGFDPGIVFVNPITVEQGGLPSITCACVNAHGTKVGHVNSI